MFPNRVVLFNDEVILLLLFILASYGVCVHNSYSFCDIGCLDFCLLFLEKGRTTGMYTVFE